MEYLYIRLSNTKTFIGALAIRIIKIFLGELTILLELSSYTLNKEGEQEQILINQIILLFIHFLHSPKALYINYINRGNNDDIKVKILNTINQLISKCDDPSKYIIQLSEFLGNSIYNVLFRYC